MNNLTGQYIGTIAIPFVIAILALAFPLMLDASSKISGQYKSAFMAKTFQREFAYRFFVISLIMSLIAIILYTFKLPAIDSLSSSWLVCNSAIIFVYFSTLILVIALILLAYIISVYYRQDRLLKHFSIRYNCIEKLFKRHDKDDFMAISKLMNYSVDNADEELARGIFSFFFNAFIKFRKDKEGQKIVYPDDFYNSVFEASEQLCMRQRKTVSYFNDGTLYDFFIDSFQKTKVSQKTLQFMWMCVIQNARYCKDEYIFSLWKKIYQHVSLFLHDWKYLQDEKRQYVEFANAICSFVMSEGNYTLLLKMMKFTQMTPARYVLTPSSTQEVVDRCIEILSHNNFPSPGFPVYWESTYPWPGIDGADAENIIEGKMIDFCALTFLWQYVVPKNFMVKGYSDSIYQGGTIEEMISILDALRRLQSSVQIVIEDGRIISFLGLDRCTFVSTICGHKSPKDWFDDNINTITEAINIKRDVDAREQEIQEDIIVKFNETVANSVSRLFETTNRFFSNVGKNKKTERFYLVERRDIEKKTHINQSINYAEVVGGLLANDFCANMWLPLLQMNVHKYVLHEDCIIDLALHWKPRKGLVILNFGIWINEDRLVTEGLLKKEGGRLYTNSRIEMIQVENSPIHPILAHSMVLLKQEDLPAIELFDVDGDTIKDLQLKRCSDEYQVYTSVIDFKKNKELSKKYISEQNDEEEKYAMFCSYMNTSLRYNPEAKVLLLSAYNQFVDRTIPQNISDVPDIWKKSRKRDGIDVEI